MEPVVRITAIGNITSVIITGTQIKPFGKITACHKIFHAGSTGIGRARLLFILVTRRTAVDTMPARGNPLSHSSLLRSPVGLQMNLSRRHIAHLLHSESVTRLKHFKHTVIFALHISHRQRILPGSQRRHCERETSPRHIYAQTMTASGSAEHSFDTFGRHIAVKRKRDVGPVNRKVKRTILRHRAHHSRRFRPEAPATHEIPGLDTGHGMRGVLRLPVSLALDLKQRHFYPVKTIGPSRKRGERTGLVGRIRLDDLRCDMTSVTLYPVVQSGLHSTKHAHIITRAVYMQYGHRARTQRTLVAHRITAHRHKGGYMLGYTVGTVICEHTTHRKSAHIHPVEIDVMTRVHLIYDSKYEIHITVARYIPKGIYGIWENKHKLGCIGHSFPR